MAAFAIYSETDFSLDFYNRDIVPAVGDTFEGKAVTKVYTNISASTPAWKSDGNIAKIVSSTVVDVVAPTSCSQWYSTASKLINVNLTNLDTSNVTTMYYMFHNCTALPSVDCSNFNTSKVTTMRSMFYNCGELTHLDVSSFDTKSVTTFEYMFYSCMQANITGFENWDTSSATSMRSMFYKCASIPHIDLSKWNVSKVTNMAYMFNRGAGTIDFSGWNTSKVENFSAMFSTSNFTYLDLSSFNVSGATTLNSMFYNSKLLKTILVSHDWNETFKDGVDTAWMFENCYALMGDIAYSDMNDAAEPENYEHMTGIYATTDGGYLTLKYDEDEESGDDSSVYNKSYMVLGSTMHELANSMRNILGTPQKIALKNFSKVLQKQVNSVHSATLIFKDRVFTGDDVSYVANIYFTNTNMTLQNINMNKFNIMPTVMKGSVIALTDVISLTDTSEIVYSGEITRLGDSLTFIINGDATIQIVKKEAVSEVIE